MGYLWFQPPIATVRSLRRCFSPPLRRKLRSVLAISSTFLVLFLLLFSDRSTDFGDTLQQRQQQQEYHKDGTAKNPTTLHLEKGELGAGGLKVGEGLETRIRFKTTFPSSSKTKQGVSLVAACRNRQEALKQVLPTWLNAHRVNQIVLVDWSSSPPLQPVINQVVSNEGKRRVGIKVVRVVGEEEWVLSRAFNLGVQKADYEMIVRLDCDYGIEKGFVQRHLFDSGEVGRNEKEGSYFYAGNYGNARNENEVHLNGAVVIKKSDFMKVGGYDERIQTYGWDDEDLYARLSNLGLNKRDVDFGVIKHVEHNDVDRLGDNKGDSKLVQVEIDLNALLVGKLKNWSKRSPMSSEYVVLNEKLVRDHQSYMEIRAVRKPKSLSQQVSPKIYQESWDLALGRRLNNDYQVPWDILASMMIPTKEALLKGLMSRLETSKASVPRVLFAHCQHGLGNRLRALGSAMAFAKNTNRELVVVWEKDAHIQADFQELFANKDLHVMTRWLPKWPFDEMYKWDASWKHMKWYNYMEMEKQGAKKGEIVENHPEKHIYYKGAYIMEVKDAKLTNWESDNDMLRTLKPVAGVEQHIRKLLDGGLKKCVGVHIRNRTLKKDIKNVDFNSEYGEDAADTMDYWRRKSSYTSFITEMRRILKKDPEMKFYVATDTVDVISILEKEFPGRILYTPRSCDDRDGECVRFALTDILALGQTKYILGSNWSSFTEAAQRIGGVQAKLAGQDFAVDPPHLRKL